MRTHRRRCLEDICRESFDMVVVGGGIYGVLISLEAARQGLRPLLIEQGDFGGATSHSSLRIIHGGLRHWQYLDLRGARQSAVECNWFLKSFPDLVQPHGFLMPLYERGLRRVPLLRMALASHARLTAIACPESVLPRSCILPADATRESFPSVDTDQLAGGALWYDAVMTNPARVLMRVLHGAESLGAIAINYVRAEHLQVRGNRVTGVEVLDMESGERLTIPCAVVICCTGVSSGLFESSTGMRHQPRLSLLGFNLVLNRTLPATYALALTGCHSQRSLFLLPRHGHVAAGTFYTMCEHSGNRPLPTATDISMALSELNRVVPMLALRERDVYAIQSGLIPAASIQPPVPAYRPRTIDHGRSHGPLGLFSVSGVKYTTARAIARHVLRVAWGRRTSAPYPPFHKCAPELELNSYVANGHLTSQEMQAQLARLISTDAVLHLDDLLLRRSEWWHQRTGVISAARTMAQILKWDRTRLLEELTRFRKYRPHWSSTFADETAACQRDYVG